MTPPVPDLRAYAPADAPEVRAIHTAAFGGPAEATLVERLHAADEVVSLVALVHGTPSGHVLFSRITIQAEEAWPAWALAPLGVLPGFQRQGVGTRLVETGLGLCRERHPDRVLVLGDPAYYARFGFERAAEHGIRPPHASWTPAFQVLALAPDALLGVHGTVRYPPAFDEV